MVDFGTVTGRLIAFVADTTADADPNPDVVPLSGGVRFTAQLKTGGGLLLSAEDAIALPAPITAEIDADGYVSLNGVRGISLVATDSADTNPSGFTYLVEFVNLKYGSTRTSYSSFSISVPSGETVDLATVAPVAASNGVLVTRGEKGDGGDLGVSTTVSVPTASAITLGNTLASSTTRLVLGGNLTVGLGSPNSTVTGTMTLVLIQDGTGGRTTTWPSSLKWAYGVAPSLPTTAGTMNVVHLFWTGVEWIGMAGALAVA